MGRAATMRVQAARTLAEGMFLDAAGRAAAEEQNAEAERSDAATWEHYRELYVFEMRESYGLQRPAWDAFLRRSRVVIACVCPGPRCHRFLAAELLEKLGAKHCGEAKQ